jgi:hypothetical protein
VTTLVSAAQTPSSFGDENIHGEIEWCEKINAFALPL